MKAFSLSQRWSQGAYRVVRAFVGLLSFLAVLLVVTFVFLRLYGVPDPLLREVIRRANNAGIPVDVGSITLTLRGWRADNVCYYSTHPDDLEPIFKSDSVFFARKAPVVGEDSLGLKFDVEAVGLSINPSVVWGVRVPAESKSRQVERVRVSLGFFSDRIVLSDGEMLWLGSQFNVDGVILKSQEGKAPPVQKQATVLPVIITSEQFQRLESRLKMLDLGAGATVDINFSVDAGDYAASRVAFSVEAEDAEWGGVDFSHAKLAGSYAYPEILLHQVSVSQNNQIAQLSGGYNLETKQIKGVLKNTITSREILLLLPSFVHDLLVKAELRLGQLPALDIEFGPALPNELLNHVAGSFAIHDLSYTDLDIALLRSEISRKNKRLEFTNLHGDFLGQEERAKELGTTMHGGSAEGSVFWDGITREFGVDVDVSLDPNILVGALSPVKIATNIIQRFSFKDQAPRGHVAVGMDVRDLNTFYIDIQAMGNDLSFQGVEFASMNVTQTYLGGILNLDPIAAVQETDFLKGSTSIDLRNSIATFDVMGSLSPAALEDMIHPKLNLFGHKIKTEGNTQIKAQGVFDWKTMQATDFTAEVEAEHLDLPVARLDNFSATVSGDGPVLEVKDALFKIYGGDGLGRFNVLLNPQTNTMPYEMNIDLKNADFLQSLQYVELAADSDFSGKLSVVADFKADMLRDFFETANGHGSMVVEKGQLADLPLFRGFSRLMRKMIPGFNVFSITSLRCGFELRDGVVHTDDAYFEGNLLSAKASGSYSSAEGYDASIQAQVFSENLISKLFRVITNPLFKLFEFRLEGPFDDPSWRLDKFSSEGRNTLPVEESDVVESD